MAQRNTKGLGKKQQHVLLMMERGQQIRHVMDFQNHTQYYTLIEDDDELEMLSLQLVQSLIDRKLIVESKSVRPSLNIYVTYYKTNL